MSVYKKIEYLVFRAVDRWIKKTKNAQWQRVRGFQKSFGVKNLRVALPQLPNEKFFWRKIFDHDPRFIIASDKIASKEWIIAQGINVKIPRTLWTGTDASQIPDDLWQRPIYIKGAHGWRMNIPVLTPPNTAERDAIIAAANSFLELGHGEAAYEWAYFGVPRRLMVEEAITPGRSLVEVKYYTFGRSVELFMITRQGPPETAARWVKQANGGYARVNKATTSSKIIDKAPLPDAAFKGLEIASAIGGHFDHMRVDTYIDGDDVILGELTVYNMTGRVAVNGGDPNDHFNRSWDLRNSWFLTTRQKGWRRVYAGFLRRALDRQYKSDVVSTSSAGKKASYARHG